MTLKPCLWGKFGAEKFRLKRGTFPPFNLSEGLGFDCKVAQHEMLVGVFTAPKDPKEKKFWRGKKGSRGFGGYWKVPG